MGDMMGMSAQKDRKAERLMKEQQQEKEAQLADEKSEIERRKLLGRKGGRSLLINTSPRGVPNTKLGG